MKRMIVIFVFLTLALLFCACGKKQITQQTRPMETVMVPSEENASAPSMDEKPAVQDDPVIPEDGMDLKDETNELQGRNVVNLLVFLAINGWIEAKLLCIDLDAKDLLLDDSALYVFPGDLDISVSPLYPQYLSESSLVLCQEPIRTKSEDCRICSSHDELYFEAYTLEYDADSSAFTLSKAGKLLYEGVPIVCGETPVRPACFYVDYAGKVVVLGMTMENLLDTQMVVMCYSEERGSLSSPQITGYDSFWTDYDVSKVLCPNYMPGYYNITACPELGGFLYNETCNLFLVQPETETISRVLSEDDVCQAIPFFDSHRDYYSLFTQCSYQNGTYTATFSALNEVPGVYTTFFSNGKYLGFLRCGEQKIVLGDSSNSPIAEIDGDFLPRVFSMFGKCFN